MKSLEVRREFRCNIEASGMFDVFIWSFWGAGVSGVAGIVMSIIICGLASVQVGIISVITEERFSRQGEFSALF